MPSKIPAKEMNRRKQQSAAAKRRNNSGPRVSTTTGSSLALGRARTAPVTTYREFVSKFRTSRSSRGDEAIAIDGMDYLGTVTLGTGVPAGTVFANYAVCPGSTIFNGSRLFYFSQLYEKYVFTRIKFHFQSANPTSANGSYLVAFDRDVSDPPPTQSDAAIRQLLSNRGSRTGAVWESVSIDCPLADTQTFYYTNYTGNDPRLAFQGRVYGAALTAVSQATLFTVWVEYEIHLMDPSLAPYDSVWETSNSLSNTNLPAMSVVPLASIPAGAPGLSGFNDPSVQLSPVSLLQQVIANGYTVAQYPASQGTTNVGPETGWKLPGGSWILDMILQVAMSSVTGTQKFEVGLRSTPNQTSGPPVLMYTEAQYANVSSSNTRYGAMESVPNAFGVKTSINTTAGPPTGTYNQNVPFRFILNVPPGGGIVEPFIANTVANALALFGYYISFSRATPKSVSAFGQLQV